MYQKVFADFFAGIGLVRMGLEYAGWNEVYSLDHDKNKKMLYDHHFGNNNYRLLDIYEEDAHAIPPITLAHASFPCTDISVAGSRNGINGKKSSAFWEFIRILRELDEKKPPIILIENVEGLLVKNGIELRDILQKLCIIGYSIDILRIDATNFVPQSRVRLFIIGTVSSNIQSMDEQDYILNKNHPVRPQKIINFIRRNQDLRWNLRNLPALPQRTKTLNDIVDLTAPWWNRERSDYLYNQMFNHHQLIIQTLIKKNAWIYGTVFRRMRQRDGMKRSTAELRIDGIAGCLRTPKGGSARQILIRIGYGTFDARLLNPVECARLMGASEYIIGDHISLNQALFGFGDAVCVDVIKWIAFNYLNPLLDEINDYSLNDELIDHHQFA